jgi:hypothetical protein
MRHLSSTASWLFLLPFKELGFDFVGVKKQQPNVLQLKVQTGRISLILFLVTGMLPDVTDHTFPYWLSQSWYKCRSLQVHD